MAQPLHTWNDLDEGAEGGRVLDRALVDPPDLGFLDDRFDHLTCACSGLTGDRRDLHETAVIDIDLGPGFFLNGTDGFSFGPNDVADLRGIDLDAHDPGGVLRKVAPRLRECLIHVVEDVHPTLMRLLERGLQDVVCQPLDLDVHLDGGHTFACASDLEVHVTECILESEDVGKNRDVVPFLDQPHRDPCTRRLHRYAGVHERKRRAAYRSHRR